MTDRLDILKETALDTQFLDCFESSASREVLTPDVRNPRLLLALYAIGTNAGLKRVAAASDVSLDERAHVHRRSMDAAALRAACGRVTNATLAIRNPEIWGPVGTCSASDSTKFGAWDRNLMTEWHARYGGRGVMIDWHVERRSACIHSQLKCCSSSEVAAMIEGVLRHCTDMEIQRQSVDSHGQSAVGFAFSHLLGFELAPRLKAIGRQKRRAHLVATEHPVDTSSATGKAFFDMLGVFAEFETNLRRERQAEGIAAAKQRGVYRGRTPTIDQDTIRQRLAMGQSPTRIAREMGISRGTVYTAKKAATPPDTTS